MNNCLFRDEKCGKVTVAGRRRVLYRRIDVASGRHVRFVCLHTKHEIAKMRKSYGIAGKNMGIESWFEVYPDDLICGDASIKGESYAGN